MIKRVFAFMMAVVILVGLLTFPAEAATTSGQIGDLYWSYNKNTYTLTITGKGDMPDFYYDLAPWRYYSSSCSPLEHVVVGEGVTSIGYNAFESLDLKTIRLPYTVRTIKYHAFQYTRIDMPVVVLPRELTEIESEAFAGAKLKKLQLSDATKTIGEKAFYNTVIESINLEAVETIGKYAFYNCRHLTGPLMLNSLKSLGDCAFEQCESLTDVTFGTKLTQIPKEAFCSSGLTSLNLPGNIKTIGDEAFHYAPIHDLTFSEGLESIGNSAFSLELQQDELVLPSTLRTIEEGGLADRNCKPVYLNEGLTKLGRYGVSNQGVLTVPSTVNKMGVRSNEALIVLGKPFKTWMMYYDPNLKWGSDVTIYTFYPREQWGEPQTYGEDEFKYVDFRMLEPEVIEIYVGQKIKMGESAGLDSLLYEKHVKFENGILTGTKPGANVLIKTEGDLTKYCLIQVLPLPESCQIGNHVWELETSSAPTCTEDGRKVLSCRLCKNTKEEITPALGHAWKLTEIQSEPEEGESLHEGVGLYTCTRCNETKEARLCAGEVFTDMPAEGNWAHKPIDWAYFSGVTSGKTATSFEPKTKITRAEAMTFLWTAAGKTTSTLSESPFTDVTAGKYYSKPVLWAVEHHITGGKTETSFAPKAQCSRAEIMTFLWNAVGKPAHSLAESPFTDVTPGKYYYNAVLWAYEKGVTGGTTDTTFSPKTVCTRAQVVTFLYKVKDLLRPAGEP